MKRFVVIADAGPLHYLVLLGHSQVFPSLFGTILIPQAVASELAHANAPTALREFIFNPPAWLTVVNDPPDEDAVRDADLAAGERAALTLALSSASPLLLCDDLDARHFAERHQITVIGTLGIVARAASRGLLTFESTLESLTTRTNFRFTDSLLTAARADYERHLRDSKRVPPA